MKKVLYKIHHLDNTTDLSRQKTYDDLEQQFSEHFDKLDTPTISIKSQSDIDSFIEQNPLFKLNGQGFEDYDGLKGWKYGEIGIWASNYLSWKKFAETDADYLILVEDDLILYTDFFSALNVYFEDMPESFDMFSVFVPMSEVGLCKEENYVGIRSICKAYQTWSLACYIVNKKTINKLITMIETKIDLPPDWFFFKQTSIIDVYSPTPADAGHCFVSNSESTYQSKESRFPVQVNNNILNLPK
jgi:GR25 family glycosyltransferase involved in LPS biosynthesis